MTESPSFLPPYNAVLVMENGDEFYGYGIGREGTVYGELCFNTAMTGYQEILTDPSYYGQIINFTTPHIGNVGCNKEDIESNVESARGCIIREAITTPSSWRALRGFDEWLDDKAITGISGLDTRALTSFIRTHGHPKVAIAYHADGLSAIDTSAMHAELAAMNSLKGLELTEFVTDPVQRNWSESIWEIDSGYTQKTHSHFHVVAIDYGAKMNILRLLTAKGCRVTVVPGNSDIDTIMKLNPDGVFLSNGPGDPAATAHFALPVIKAILEKKLPLFGICLGHQLLALALGAKTDKMYQGHRGANHPVKHLDTGKVEITSQNHGFVVHSDSLPAHVKVTHLSLFDGTIEGIKSTKHPAFSVQYHPESSPGPHDSEYLFDHFVTMIRENRGV
jgi:carbamoyl-phosphate synthase small subunit